MPDQVGQLATLRGELREEKEVVAALEESKADCERILSKKIEELGTARKQRDEELAQRLIGLHNGTAPDRDERYQMAWRAGVAAAQDAIREEKPDVRA